MKVKKTTNNVLGVVQLTPRKRSKRTKEGALVGIFDDKNVKDYVYFRAVFVPTGLHEDTVKELELNNLDNIYFGLKGNLQQNPRFSDSDIKGEVILVDPFCIMGIISEEDKYLFEEFGGKEVIIEE